MGVTQGGLKEKSDAQAAPRTNYVRISGGAGFSVGVFKAAEWIPLHIQDRGSEAGIDPHTPHFPSQGVRTILFRMS